MFSLRIKMNATGLSVFGLLGFIALLVSAKQDWKPLHVQPEHIHLSLGGLLGGVGLDFILKFFGFCRATE